LNVSFFNLGEFKKNLTGKKRIFSQTQHIHLSLEWNNISGSIPSEIGLMTILNYFELGKKVYDFLPGRLVLLNK